MSGIAGLYFHDQPADPALLERMGARLGAVSSAQFIDGGLGLVQAGPTLPVYGDEQVVVADGVPLNEAELRVELQRRGCRYLSDDPRETFVHAYAHHDVEALTRLFGVFALALYDRPRRRLLLARDRLGQAPLFMAYLPEGIAFASRLRALLPALGARARLEPRALAEFLHHGYSAGRTTSLQDVRRILPGEAVILEEGRIRRRWAYWSALEAPQCTLGPEAAGDQFGALLDTVLRQHLRGAAAWGLRLSPQVDGQILLAMLSNAQDQPVATHAAGEASERVMVALAQRYGAQHRQLRLEGAALARCLPAAVWAADELVDVSAALPQALLARELGDGALISSEGGDQVFAGAEYFGGVPLLRWFHDLLDPAGSGFRGRGALGAAGAEQLLGEALREAYPWARWPLTDAWNAPPANWSELQRMQYTDLVTLVPDRQLAAGRRLLGAAGVEGRYPLLDHRIVEFGLTLPDEYKVVGRRGKLFLREWSRSLLIQGRLARGLKPAPPDGWFDGGLVAAAGRVLPTLECVRDWFQPRAVAHLAASARHRPRPRRLLLALLQFALWHRLMLEERGRSRPEEFVDPLMLLGRP